MGQTGKQQTASVLSTLCVWLFFIRPAFAQTKPAGDSTRDNLYPQIRLSSPSTTYHLGERIPLVLTFTSATPKRWVIETGGSERNSLASDEQFIVEPKQGTSDPLKLYLSSIGGFWGGILSGIGYLSTSPTLIDLDLNEWVRFDQPGIYQLTVISHRVSDSHVPFGAPGQDVELKSNPVKLKIIPADPTWQRAKLLEILNTLDRGAPFAGDVSNDPKEAALKALSFLGTEDAARELARHLRGENSSHDWQCVFGLVGSPHRHAAFDEMNRLFDDPDFAVSGLFLYAMSVLSLDAGASRQVLVQEQQHNLAFLHQRLLNTVTAKRGKALAISLDAVMSGMDANTSPLVRSELLPLMIDNFRQLPVESQVNWLQYGWKNVKDPRWLPLLRSIAQHYEDYPELRVFPAYASIQLTGMALKRWYELDPEGARSAVIEEITRSKPRYDAAILGILPDKTLPESEQMIADHFLATDNYEIEGNLASLMFRYADAGILQKVLGKIDAKVGTWACVPQDESLAYVLKVDPDTAKPLIERAIQARGPNSNACRHGIFTDIGRLQTSPVLEELAIGSLRDPDPEVAANAAGYLGDYGSQAAEQPLWSRYEEWSRKWAGRASELQSTFGNQPKEDASLGPSLARALETGVGWLSGPNKLRRIQAVALLPEMRRELQQAIQSWQGTPRMPFRINYFSSSPPQFGIAQYTLHSTDALETKLAEFPRGTKFLWTVGKAYPSGDDAEKTFQEISAFARKEGIQLVVAPPGS
ncbi:MAG: HEAT repeat domain-containing protein [Terriglobia bacterium]